MNLLRSSQMPKNRNWCDGYDEFTGLDIQHHLHYIVVVRRTQLSQSPPLALRPIGEHWIDRFRTRHPGIQGIWTHQIDSTRHTAVNAATVRTWFDAVTEQHVQHQYQLYCICNMDES